MSDTYEVAKKKLGELIDWHVQVAIDPAVNGGCVLVPARVPLTDEKIVAVRKSQVGRYGSVDPAKPYSDSIAFARARAIEAAHGITK